MALIEHPSSVVLLVHYSFLCTLEDGFALNGYLGFAASGQSGEPAPGLLRLAREPLNDEDVSGRVGAPSHAPIDDAPRTRAVW